MSEYSQNARREFPNGSLTVLGRREQAGYACWSLGLGDLPVEVRHLRASNNKSISIYGLVVDVIEAVLAPPALERGVWAAIMTGSA